MRTAVSLLLAVPVLPALLAAGCLDCTPVLDVRQCLPGSTACAPREGDVHVAWNATLAAAWPDIDALLQATGPGDHSHKDWSAARREQWWAAWGVPLNATEKQAFFDHEGGLFRVRVLEC